MKFGAASGKGTERVPSSTEEEGRSELEAPIAGTDHWIFGTFCFKFLGLEVVRKKEKNTFSLTP